MHPLASTRGDLLERAPPLEGLQDLWMTGTAPGPFVVAIMRWCRSDVARQAAVGGSANAPPRGRRRLAKQASALPWSVGRCQRAVKFFALHTGAR
jgi:hypothetical protein